MDKGASKSFILQLCPGTCYLSFMSNGTCQTIMSNYCQSFMSSFMSNSQALIGYRNTSKCYFVIKTRMTIQLCNKNQNDNSTL